MEDIALNIIHAIPKHIDECVPENIFDFFSGPTLIEIDQGQEEWLFVSVLLHGNELVGLDVLKKIQKEISSQKKLSKNLAIFVGNIAACQKRKRKLSHQPDFNRIWSPEQRDLIPQFGQELLSWVSQKKLFAAIDVHNTTGKNPFYGCVTNISFRSLFLASLFSKTGVYFETPRNVLIRVLSDYCPSVVIECGLPNNPLGGERAFSFVWKVLNMENLNPPEQEKIHLNLYHTVGRIVLKENKTFGFGLSKADISFDINVEDYNFVLMEKGTCFAKLSTTDIPLQVIDENFNDITDHFLEKMNGQVCIKRNTVPALITKDRNVIVSDCFGYFMEPLKLPFHIDNLS